MVKVTRFQIIRPVDMDWKEFGKILSELRYETRIIANRTMRENFLWEELSFEKKQTTGKYPKVEEVHRYKALTTYIYNSIESELTEPLIGNTGNRSTSIRKTSVAYKTHSKDIHTGKASVPNFGKNQPIDIHNKNIRLVYDKEKKTYFAILSLLAKEGKEKFKLPSGQIMVVLGTMKNASEQKILERCISGEYKVCTSQILHVKNKDYFNLCYEMDSENEPLDPEKIMGVDLGVKIPAYMAFNNSEWARYSIKDNRIMMLKYAMDKQLSCAKQSKKYVGPGRCGHGRAKRVDVYNRYSNKSRNLSQTINHTWAREIVNQAEKHGCGTIQMEDLSGITSEKSKFLKNWTYFDLQMKVEQKAKEKNIAVIKVEPKYTSQRCSKCGYIDKENRPEQATFKCLKCGYETNADFNAARNIATKNIAKIIANTLELQAKSD